MSKNPYISSDFTRITAVRLNRTLGNPLAFLVEDLDLVHGVLARDGVPIGGRDLAPRRLGAAEQVVIRVEANTQGQMVLAKPVWEAGCFAPILCSLGSFCPLDTTDDEGRIPDDNRELYWNRDAVSPFPPEKSLDITLNGNGEISWSSRGLSSKYVLTATAATAEELHIILVTRNGEGGNIFLPACDSKLATELKL